jgi:aarF domain-containing kinase
MLSLMLLQRANVAAVVKLGPKRVLVGVSPRSLAPPPQPVSPRLTARRAVASSSLSSAAAHHAGPTKQGQTVWWTTAAALGGAAAATTVFAVVPYFHAHFGGWEGLSRAASFYSVAIPKYAVYRYHQWMESPEEVWDKLHRETSQQGLEVILRLRGFYIKCGQLCASNIGDAFPVIWQETMSVLQDQVPPEDFETVVLPILNDELDFNDTFATFDPVPIGSASIGQVHRAMLMREKDNVVVKICYPHVERLLRGDVRTIRAFCEVAQPVHVPGIKEVEKQFPSEFNYRTEAENLRLVRDNLTRAGLCGPDKMCIVPMPYPEYCTKRVLVMEELHGEKLVDVLKRDAQRWAALAAAAAGTSRNPVTDDTSSPVSAAVFEMYLAKLDAARRAQNAWTRLYNSTVGLVLSSKRRDYQSKAELPLNPAQIVDDLLYIHGHEVLVDGRFNADCHPGA